MKLERFLPAGRACAVVCAVLSAMSASGEPPALAGLPGPSANPDDQFRFFWLLRRENYEKCRDAGLNLFINSTRESRWWALAADDRSKLDASALDFIRRVHADGLDYVEKLALNACKDLRTAYPQTRKDGSPNLRSYDLANPEFVALRDALMSEAAASVRDFPIVGVHPSSEVRDGSKPSFSPWYRAKCRAELGYDMPEDITASRLTVEQLHDLPVSGVVAKSYRPLEYLTWFWRNGDGWNRYQDDVVSIFREKTGKKNLFSVFDPVTRAPPLWGMGGNVDFGDQWYYSCPEPYGLSFGVSEQQAMSRGSPGRGDFAIAQGIINREWAVSRKGKIANPPDWAGRIDPKIRYVSMPADFIREGIWTLFSRKLDGIGLYGSSALFPSGDPARNACTDTGAFEAVRDAFVRVGIKLGPLLRAVPERKPAVAFLESSASSILAGRGSMGWAYAFGDVFVAANLVPYVIYEEEIEKTGIPENIDVLAMPDAPVLLETTYKALKGFQDRGGLIVSDGDPVPGILPDVTLPEYLPRTRAQRLASTERDGVTIRRAAKALRSALAGTVVPYADSDNPEIIVHARTYRAADYVFAVNDKRGFGDYTGPWKRMNEKGLPNSGTVTVRRTAGAVYDLERQCAVEFETKDGAVRIPVSYATTDGRVFLVAPRKLSDLGVAVADGMVSVTSADTDVMIPIAVSAPGMKTLYGVVESGGWKRALPATAGVTVVNLADGTSYYAGSKAGPRIGKTAAAVRPKPAGPVSAEIRMRSGFRAALAGEEGFDKAVGEAFASSDAAVRRYALYRLYERDKSAGEREAKRLLADPSASVRILAKRIVRVGVPFRANEAWSLSPQNDHSTVRVKSVRVKKGVFSFPAGLSGYDAIELWFGRPDKDLYVTVNGVFLGQFDADAGKGGEFRLDATKETKLGEVNVLEVTDARGVPVESFKATAEAVKW